jgi:hypothetical protein
MIGIACLAARWNTKSPIVPPFLMLGPAVFRMIEILIFGGAFYALDVYTSMGTFEGEFNEGLRDYIYFSGVSYTTMGLSNFYPLGAFKTLSMVVEALAGFMMLTWSATFFYSVAGRILIQEQQKTAGQK